MPVFINEVITDAVPNVVPPSTQQPAQEAMPISRPEYELMSTLSLLNERQTRLQFD